MENNRTNQEKMPTQKEKGVDQKFDPKVQESENESTRQQDAGDQSTQRPQDSSVTGRGGVNEQIRGRESDQGNRGRESDQSKSARESPEKIRERRDAWNDPTRGDTNERK